MAIVDAPSMCMNTSVQRSQRTSLLRVMHGTCCRSHWNHQTDHGHVLAQRPEGEHTAFAVSHVMYSFFPTQHLGLIVLGYTSWAPSGTWFEAINLSRNIFSKTRPVLEA